MVSLLRASGAFATEDIAKAFGLSEKTIRRLATERGPGDVPTNPARPHWTRESIARAMLEFFEEEERWPTARDFRAFTTRNRYGLPSWDQLSSVARGIDVRRVWGWRPHEEARRALRRDGLMHRAEGTFFPSGITLMQRWMSLQDMLEARHVMRIPNALVRREAIERYGFDRMVREGAAERIGDPDAKFGTLWRLPGERAAESMVMLEVVNRTAEPDGTFAHYFLRVPPTMTHPRQAAAWTFDVTDGWEDFDYEKES